MSKPRKTVHIPRGHYCVVENPVKVKKNYDGKWIVEKTKNKTFKLQHNKREYRFGKRNMIIYPGEKLQVKLKVGKLF